MTELVHMVSWLPKQGLLLLLALSFPSVIGFISYFIGSGGE